MTNHQLATMNPPPTTDPVPTDKTVSTHPKSTHRGQLWNGVNHLPVTILLWLLSMFSFALCTWSFTIGPVLETSSVLMSLTLITCVHTTLDFSIHFTSQLQPAYVAFVSPILLTGYTGALILSGIKSGSNDYGTCEPNIVSYQMGHADDSEPNGGDHFQYQQGCSVTRSQCVLIALMMVLYIISTILSIKAQRLLNAFRPEWAQLPPLALLHAHNNRIVYVAECAECAACQSEAVAPAGEIVPGSSERRNSQAETLAEEFTVATPKNPEHDSRNLHACLAISTTEPGQGKELDIPEAGKR